eukprot:TRINITY_DN24426_c0_g2_i1.p1 TRINITY_DN24426_c0_g2~~TRINITY_DN24426_c0_g2_i1.p1  ORF type:complete len:379 (+),score=93.89 TRINITY_DN24426_c0_g2_i1:162-1298(+)
MMASRGTRDLLREVRKVSGVSPEPESRIVLGPIGDVRKTLAVVLGAYPEFKAVVRSEMVARASVKKAKNITALVWHCVDEGRVAILPARREQLLHDSLEAEARGHAAIKNAKKSCIMLSHVRKNAVTDEEAEAAGTDAPPPAASEDAEGDASQGAGSTEKPKESDHKKLRDNLSTALFYELNQAREGLDKANEQRTKDWESRTYRLLKYCFPDASEEEYAKCLDKTELAEEAIRRRLECATGMAPSLGLVMSDLQSSKVYMKRRLETESKELAIIFARFKELVHSNDEVLSEIEENILSTLENTQKALGTLKEAVHYKRQNIIRAFLMKVLFFLMLFYIIWYFVGGYVRKAIFSDMEKNNEAHHPASPPPSKVNRHNA